jgi:hypothetical protein
MAWQDVLGYPDDGGYGLAFSSIEISVAGVRKVVGTKSIKYTDSLTIGSGYGSSPHRIIRTRGQLAPAGTWEVYRSSFDMLIRDAFKIGKLGFAEVALPIFVSYGEPSNPLLTVCDTLLGVRVHSPEGGGQEGVDPLVVPLQLDIMRIIWAKGKGSPGMMQLSALDQIIRTGAL